MRVTRLPAQSSTVTGTELPSSLKMRIMPTFRPTRPRLIFFPFFLLVTPHCCIGVPAAIGRRLLCEPGRDSTPPRALLDLHVHARGQVELGERVHRLVRRIDDVDQ